MKITKHAVVAIDYTLKDDQGTVIDSSSEGQPLQYVHGVGGLIPGLEKELEGKGAGDALQVRVDPENGYGERVEGMVQMVPRAQLPTEVEITVGMQFQAQSEAGVHIVTVTAVEGDNVQLDANHPLAGVHLNFDVKVTEVREATPAEIEQGQVGPGAAG